MQRRSDYQNEIARLRSKVEKLEKLVEIISRGKYMWESTFDAITDPVMIISKSYQIERANLAVANTVDEDIVDVIGKCCYEAFAGRDKPCEGCPLLETIQTDKLTEGNLSNRVVGREFVAHAYPLTDAHGNLNSAVVHYVDVTEQRRLQQELIQQEKMAAIGMLAGGVAHEINNPLGGVLAFTQLVLRELDDGNPIKADVKEIEQAALRCKKIVADLLDFSRASKEKEKKFIQVNDLVDKVLPLIKSELKSYNIDLVVDLDPSLPKVYGSANRLQQVFLNLLTNACHAMTKGGKLYVRSYYDKVRGEVHISVSDEGCGISEENMDKIFDPFFTTKAPGKGTGLGLSVSYKIVQEHGGSIIVESREGKGSTFTVCLPLNCK